MALASACSDADTGGAARTKTSSVDTSPKPGDPVVDLRHPVRLERIATLDAPIAAASRAGDDSLYVAERAGTIRRLSRSDTTWHVQKDPVLDLTEQVGAVEGEQGLLGLAFSPDGHTLVVDYTDGSDDGATVIDRFAVTEPTMIDPSTRREVLRVPQPFSNHNGGDVHFGPDGALFIALGDGGGQGDPEGRAQNLDDRHGKILRIRLGDGDGYEAPADNPFARDERRGDIWLSGVRNPWRFSFDRENGDLWIGDVGASAWEEINRLPASEGRGRGANLGWDLREGREATDESATPPDDLVDPLYVYGRDQGSTVVGGVVYRGVELQHLRGAYLYADFGKGALRALVARRDGTIAALGDIDTGDTKLEQPVSFAEDNGGEVVVLDLAGPVYRLRAN